MEAVHPVGLYDACIIGSGDNAILCAGLKNRNNPPWAVLLQWLADFMSWNEIQRGHFVRWAGEFGDRIDGNIGFLEDVAVELLFHGRLQNRAYVTRHRLLHGFDPFRDLVWNADRCWCWATAKPHLHSAVRDYFTQRREDDA
jgi:hypothetical protein